MTSSSPPQILPPDLIHGVPKKTCPLQSSKFNFIPSISSSQSSSSPSAAYIPKSRTNGNNNPTSTFKINPSLLSSGSGSHTSSFGGTRKMNSKRKTDDSMSSCGLNEFVCEPQRKVHLNEELVAQTMSELYISHPRPKVARRNFGADVAEAINLSSLEDLETKFSHQNLEDYTLPPQRTRKLPNRSKLPQLRVSLHQDLRNLRTPASLLPESLLAKYRPSSSSRSGSSTAVVLWQPPGGQVPDIISSALRSGPGTCHGYTTQPVTSRPRIRCYSEVTSTPYSSHENLSTGGGPGMAAAGEAMAGHQESPGRLGPESPGHSPSAEAPELSAAFIGEIEADAIPIGVNLHRRNSAPEINESVHFNDDSSMEL